MAESVNRRRTDNTMVKRRTDNTMDKRMGTKEQTTIYKTLHIKLKINSLLFNRILYPCIPQDNTTAVVSFFFKVSMYIENK